MQWQHGGLVREGRKIRKSKVYSLGNEDFRKLVMESHGYSEILRKIGLKARGGNSSKALKCRIKSLNIDTSHFKKKWENGCAVLEYPNEKMFSQNSNVATCHLKRRILRDHLLDYKCEICGNGGNWNGKKLVLQLDHKNGNCIDNRLENIRFLCPNCHSQTDTYAAKNIQHTNRK